MCITMWTAGPQLRVAVVTVTFIVTLIVINVTEGREQHMWAHSEKSIMAESMGTGVVPSCGYGTWLSMGWMDQEEWTRGRMLT